MIKIQLDACTEVTVESVYGYSRETEVAEMFKLIEEAGMPAIKEALKDQNAKVEEILREQIYFAQELISNIKETIRRLGDKPLREPAREALQGIMSEIDNSMFEL